MSCSGGEASLMADAIGDRPLHYPPLSDKQQQDLRAALGPMVALANPLDYHTYIWNDRDALTATFTAMLQTPATMTFLVIDFPRTDICDDDSWWVALHALVAARDATGASVAVLATLPENLPESVSDFLMERAVPSFGGVDEALDAVVAASVVTDDVEQAPLLYSPVVLQDTCVLSEFQSKTLLRQAGLPVAQAVQVSSENKALEAVSTVGYPLVIKVSGVAHKTEQSGVVLNVQTDEDLSRHAKRLLGLSDTLLLEPYFQGSVAEMLLGVVREPDGLFRLTIGSGGVLTEVMQDTVSLLLPVSEAQLQSAIAKLRIASLLNGYRGQAMAHIPSIISTILKLCEWVESHAEHLAEVEINPLLCLESKSIVADALITSSNSFPVKD